MEPERFSAKIGSCFLLFFTPFAIYLTTLCPTMYWRDAPEFQVVGYQLGIAHPAGSPVYALVAKIFTSIPFGSIAFKTNLVSAFFGALLIFLVFLLIINCLGFIFPVKGNRLSTLAATLAVSFYAVSMSLWHNSIVAEVYTLQNCFIVSIAILLLRGVRESRKPLIYLAAFLFGLSTGAHIIMILYIPASLLFIWLFYRRFFTPHNLGIIVMFLILGASIYLYLPARSSANPYYDWGNPENAENFVTHVTDRKDTNKHFYFSLETSIQNLTEYSRYYLEDFNVIGIVLGITGMGIFFRKNPRLFLGLGIFFFSQWWFFIRYWPWSSAFIATFIFFTLGIGVGIFGIITNAAKLSSFGLGRGVSLLKATLVVACCSQIFLSGGYHGEIANRSGYWSPYLFFTQLYDQLAFKGVLLNTHYFFGLSYLQQCEQYRPDVTNLNLSEILYPQCFSPLSSSRYPLISLPAGKGSHVIDTLITSNLEAHRFYWEPRWDRIEAVNKNLLPDGFILTYSQTPANLTMENKNSHRNKIKDFLTHFSPAITEYNDAEECSFYSLMLENLGIFFYNLADYPLAFEHLFPAYTLSPDSVKGLNGLAACCVRLNRFADAERYVKRALDIEPASPTSLQLLGRIYRETGRHASAARCYEAIIRKDPQNRAAHLEIGIVFSKTGEVNHAREAFDQVISLGLEEDSLTQQARNHLHLLATRIDKN